MTLSKIPALSVNQVVLSKFPAIQSQLKSWFGDLTELSGSDMAEKLRAVRQEALAAGDLEKALAASRCWWAIEESGAASLACADDLRRVGDAREASLILLEGIGRGVESSLIWRTLGQLHEEMIEPQAAVWAYSRALALDPDDLDARLGTAMCHFDSGDFGLAAEQLDVSARLEPASPHVSLNRGLVELAQGRPSVALGCFRRAADILRGPRWTAGDLRQRLRERNRETHDPDWGVNRAKLIHDIEQIQFLIENGHVPDYFEMVLEDYHAALEDPSLPRDSSTMIGLNPRQYPLFAATYKKPFFIREPGVDPMGALSHSIDWERIQWSYVNSAPSNVCIDGLLTPSALSALREWCLQSTFWNAVKGGYLGAYLFDNFCCELLLQISEELRERLPRVLGRFPLGTTWAYKYDASYKGIGLHADVAAVNVNFWITPDDANLDPKSGGLLIYEHEAPKEWSFDRFNRQQSNVREYLESRNSQKVRVPYQCNRALMFDSDLFHETDHFQFKPGYRNRRINITMLFGSRQ